MTRSPLQSGTGTTDMSGGPSFVRALIYTLLAVLLIMITVGIMFGRREPTYPHKATPAELTPRTTPHDEPARPATTTIDPYVTISAQELFAAFDANEIAAGERFKNTKVRVSGTIEDIGTDLLGTPYITLATSGIWSVQAMFPRNAKSQLASLAKGQPQTVRCDSASKFGSIILRGCSLGR